MAKDLLVNVHSRVSSLKLETIQMSINYWMNEQMWYIHTMEYYSAIKGTNY